MARGSLPDTHWPDREIPGWVTGELMQTVRPGRSDAPMPLQGKF